MIFQIEFQEEDAWFDPMADKDVQFAESGTKVLFFGHIFFDELITEDGAQCQVRFNYMSFEEAKYRSGTVLINGRAINVEAAYSVIASTIMTIPDEQMVFRGMYEEEEKLDWSEKIFEGVGGVERGKR